MIVLEHQILAIDASGGGEIAWDLELGEPVLWTADHVRDRWTVPGAGDDKYSRGVVGVMS